VINLKKKIESLMNDNGKERSFPFERIMCGLSKCYGQVMDVRESLYDKEIVSSGKLPCMVISVGNITVGGTGKTPMTIYLARLVRGLGYSVVIVSRGYGGSASKEGGIVSNGENVLLNAEQAGDEPFMMATQLQDVPVVVGSKRFEAGMKAVKEFAPQIILLDDAFQHKKLKRDLDILLMDGSRPFGNRYIMPRGTLREPVKAIKRAGVFVLTRTSKIPDHKADFLKTLSDFEFKNSVADTPVFATTHEPHVAKIVTHVLNKTTLPEKPDIDGILFFAFSGIAKNDDFRNSVKNMGGMIQDYMEFSDHYSYRDSDLEKIVEKATESGAQCIITTEKDYVRTAGRIKWPLDLYVIGVDISFGCDEEKFKTLIETKIKESVL
jgi:tetraacyldisaccharide 4'-kinase